jgi:1-acyl-sn-glycerol-3-phosphate acyltransferase
MRAAGTYAETVLRTPRSALENIKELVLSGAAWGAGTAWLLPSTTALMGMQKVWRPDQLQWMNRLYCDTMVRATFSKWRAVVHPGVDPKRQYIFAQNHTNHFDQVTMYCATPHFKQGLELETHFDYPFYGWFMKSRGTIPVPADRTKRTDAIREHMRREVFEENHSILAFPEGTRTADGRVKAFRRGIFYIARDLGIPIVPTTVTGMFDIMRKGSIRIHPGKEITVYIDEPVETAGLTDAQVPELVEHVHSVISARVDAWFDARAAEARA